MSASTELLIEQIKQTEQEIFEANSTNNVDEAVKLSNKLSQLQKQLVVANQALTEGRHILKG